MAVQIFRPRERYQDLFGDMRFQDNPQNSRGAVIGFAGLNMWRGTTVGL